MLVYRLQALCGETNGSAIFQYYIGITGPGNGLVTVNYQVNGGVQLNESQYCYAYVSLDAALQTPAMVKRFKCLTAYRLVKVGGR